MRSDEPEACVSKEFHHAMAKHLRVLVAGWAIAIMASPVIASDESTARPASGLAETLAAEDRSALVADVERLGDAARGSTVFHTRHMTCLQCHVVGAGVSPLGPSLAAMPAGVPRETLVAHLVESLLDPSAVIRPEHRRDDHHRRRQEPDGPDRP